MDRLGSILRFLVALAAALAPVGIYVLGSDDARTTLVVALLVVGAFVAWHLLRALGSGDDDVWHPGSVRSIELPLPRDDAAKTAADALAYRMDSRDVRRSAFTITGVVGESNSVGIGTFLVTIDVRDAGGDASTAVVEVEPDGGGFARALDFGRGHRIASSLERAIGDLAAKRAAERAYERNASAAGTEPAARG